MQLKVYFEGNHMAARTFRKKKQQQSRVFLCLHDRGQQRKS